MKPLKDYEYLVDAFSALPSIGSKNARKIAHFVIKQDKLFCSNFANRILAAKNKLEWCSICHNLTDISPCIICSDKTRSNKLCVVADIEDLEKIEKTNFDGFYHVLHGEIDFKKNIKNDNLFLEDLKKRIIEQNYEEVLIATSFSINGENTTNYIINMLHDIKNLSIYRIGLGIPLNASIDYVDQETLNQSILNKRKIK